MIIKKCLECGKEFKVRPSCINRKYCSKKCYGVANKGMKLHKPNCQCSFCKAKRGELSGVKSNKFNGGNFIITCKYCGKEFEVIPSRKNIAKYCSYECYRRYNGHRVKVELKECVVCGKLTKNKKYCSRECVGKDRIGNNNVMSNGGFLKYHKEDCSCSFCKSMRGELKGKNSPAYKGASIKKICVNCGKEFETYKAKNFNCCSAKCVVEYYVGEKHWGWKGGISKLPYPFEFNEELKEQIRTRDNHTCQLCGITEEENILLYGVKLDVHHIDYNKKNSVPENLISLCKHCHGRTNYNREYWKEYFQEKAIK